MRSSKRGRRLQIAAFLLAGMASLWIFQEIGNHNLSTYSLGLGTTHFMSQGYVFFLLFWSVFGALAALFFSGAIAAASHEDWASHTIRQLRETSDRSLILALSLIGFCIPLLIRWRILMGADIADDESAYRFMAELLASGRLYAESPPMKLFFDRAFMINDGKFYSQYFLGWPALLAPGAALGVPSLMNPLYSALTVPPIFLTLRSLGGRRSGMIGAIVFLSAPLLQFGAATQLSHTSCLFALAWTTYFAIRIYTGDDKWWLHSALATSFSVAFLVRPSSALALGIPLLAIWLFSLSSLHGSARRNALAAFAAPALGFAAVFFAINMLQNGGFTSLAYQRAVQYARENGFRFAAWNWFPKDRTLAMSFGPIGLAAAQTGVSLTRLNYALFGWPLAFVFLPFAGWRSHRSWIPWSMLISFAATHFYMRNGGIDTFGPVHYLESALPVILLTALGITRLTSWLRAVRSTGLAQVVSARAPLALCLGLIIASGLGYMPVRAMALNEVGAVTGLPQRTARAELEEPTVVFVQRPFIPSKCSQTNHFLYWRPNNDPDLQNPILWVNHLTVEHDKKLMELYPHRNGVVMVWSTTCIPTFLPLSAVDDANFPPGRIGGSQGLPPVEEMQ
jgi:4-amino-4-deoxy-L-arabinose transferase-like glycosyltransferase